MVEKRQDKIFEYCKCVSDKYQIPGKYCQDQYRTGGIQHCDKTREKTKCEDDILNKINENFQQWISMPCRPKCNQINYGKFVSTSSWPSHLSESKVIEEIRSVHEKLLLNNLTSTLDEIANAQEEELEEKELLESNFLKIVVYAESISGNSIVEEDAYTIPNFLGEVGGIVGLWLGGSVVTMFEPVQLLIKLVLLFWRKKGKKSTAKADFCKQGKSGADTQCPKSSKTNNEIS